MAKTKSITARPRKTKAADPKKKTCVWKLYKGDQIRVKDKIYTVGIPDTMFFSLASSSDGDVIRPAYGTPIRWVEGAYELVDILAEARKRYGIA